YASAGEIDTLKKRRHIGMNGNAARGLPTSSHIPLSHLLIRNSNGKMEKLIVDPSKRRLFSDVATLVLEGVPWTRIERELWARYRHGKNGEPYKPGYMKHVLHNPYFWGHIARWYSSPKHPNGKAAGAWIWDENESLPEGVAI